MKKENAKIQQTADSRQQTADSRQQTLFARLRNKLKEYRLIYYPVHYILVLFRNFKPFIKWQVYKYTVKFNRNGLNNSEQRPRKIIASLTSYPARIKIVPYVIASILNQTMKPDKIILWLAESQFPDKKLPPIFAELKACGVEVKFCHEDIGPHKKYYYAMKEFPEDIIVTFDDDIVYRNFIIETLYQSYITHPDCVSAMRVTVMNILPDGSFSTPFYSEPDNTLGKESYSFFATNGSGSLFPPKCLPDEVFSAEVIKKLCPNADDIWLRIMEIINGTKVVSAFACNKTQGLSIVSSQKYALYKTNVLQRNDILQLNNLLTAYSDWRDTNGRTLLEVIRDD